MPGGDKKDTEEKVAAGKKRYEQWKKQQQKEKGKKQGGSGNNKKDIAGASSGGAADAHSVDVGETEETELDTDLPSKVDDNDDVEVKGNKNKVRDQTGEENKQENKEAATPEGKVTKGASKSDGKKPQNTASAPQNSGGETVQDIHRKQVERIEELERDNKRLQTEALDAETRWKKTEEELEERREASIEMANFRANAKETEELKSEVAALQRQTTHLQSLVSKQPRRVSTSASASSSPSAQNLTAELTSKQARIEALELELSNIQRQLTSEKDQVSSQAQEINTLESSLSRAEASQSSTATELSTLKASLENASKEGNESSDSASTRVATLEAELAAVKHSAAAAKSRAATVERKIEALTSLHREAEARNAAKRANTSSRDGTAESKNQKKGKTNEEEEKEEEEEEEEDLDSQAVSNLESESRSRMQERIRLLEDEVFELRRTEWRNKRRELQPEIDPDTTTTSTNVKKDGEPISPPFHDVDLSSGSNYQAGAGAGLPLSSAAVRRGASSFAHALSSGFSAFTSSNSDQYNIDFNNSSNIASSSEKHLTDDVGADMDADFDESAFRAAQEEEARRRVERIREVKRGLAAWKGWRVDLVGERGTVNAGNIKNEGDAKNVTPGIGYTDARTSRMMMTGGIFEV